MASIRYQIIQPSQHEEALTFYYEHFLTQDPVFSCFATIWQRHPYIDNYVYKALHQNTCWCAIYETSDKIVGVCLCTSVHESDLVDNNQQPSTVEEYIAQGLPEGLAYIEVAKREFMSWKQIMNDYSVSQLVLLSGLGVHPDYQRRGIATILFERAIDHAVQRDYHFCVVGCASLYSQKLSEKLKFERISELIYAEYIINGKVVFKDVKEPHKSVVLYNKRM